MNDMVMHFATSNKVACGRNNHNLISGRTIDGVTCKSCRNSEAFRAAVAAANTASPASAEPVPVAVKAPVATIVPAAGVAFGEWLRKLGKGERLPRGRYFAGKQAGESRPLRAYQVGDSDVVAAYDPQGAIAAMCQQTGQALDDSQPRNCRMNTTPQQGRMLFGDEADAHAFWKDKEFKTFAVDLVHGNGKKRKVIRTMYVRARTGLDAAKCAKENDWSPKPKPYYVPRLAGPRELGCVPSKG